MFVLHFLLLNVDNLIHARPEACFPSSAKCPVSELPTLHMLNTLNHSYVIVRLGLNALPKGKLSLHVSFATCVE